MKPTSKWLPELRTAVAGADDAMLLQALDATIREFFTRGGGWKQALSDITLKEGKTNYTINPQTEGVVLYPDSAKMDDTPINVWPEEASANHGVGIYRKDENTVVIRPEPNAAMDGKKLKIVALWKLPAGCTSVPDALFDIWFEEILDGTKARLYMMASKPWSSTTLGAYHHKRFRIAIGRFRSMMRKGYTTAEPAWKFPAWA